LGKAATVLRSALAPDCAGALSWLVPGPGTGGWAETRPAAPVSEIVRAARAAQKGLLLRIMLYLQWFRQPFQPLRQGCVTTRPNDRYPRVNGRPPSGWCCGTCCTALFVGTRQPHRFATATPPRILALPDTVWINRPAEDAAQETDPTAAYTQGVAFTLKIPGLRTAVSDYERTQEPNQSVEDLDGIGRWQIPPACDNYDLSSHARQQQGVTPDLCENRACVR
jgi:hypothetical protein